MRVLIIHSGRYNDVSPYVKDQCEWLSKSDIDYDLYPIAASGKLGYFKAIFKLRNFLRMNAQRFDLIHAHYGLSGLVATFQRRLPVVVTYHGSDIHQKKIYKFSRITIKRANYNIFVSEKLRSLAQSPENSSVIPCGVDFSIFNKKDKREMREKLGLQVNKKYVLFSSSFSRTIKNSELAIEAVQQLDNTELIELKGFSRTKVAEMINAVDVCLLTSENEGSPQFIKEAAACQQHIITTDVGDIREILSNYSNVKYITPEVMSIKKTLSESLKANEITETEYTNLVSRYDNREVIKKIIEIYQSIRFLKQTK